MKRENLITLGISAILMTALVVCFIESDQIVNTAYKLSGYILEMEGKQ